jgi:hypothetical protein
MALAGVEGNENVCGAILVLRLLADLMSKLFEQAGPAPCGDAVSLEGPTPDGGD